MPPRHEMASLPERVADRYEPEELLGSGGMGEVWRVRDCGLNRAVALKVIRADLVDDNWLARFLEEARIAAQLQHPGIIPIHDFGRLEDGRIWFTMKEVRGRTLEDHLQELYRATKMDLPPPSGVSIRRLLEGFLRVCETVAYAHARGVIHRDIKLTNVMIGDFGEVLVLDWGLAKLVEGHQAADPIQDRESEDILATRMGAITGTPAYMAPEQARGDARILGPTADVYGLGAVLYDLLCQRPPRLARTAAELIKAVADATPIAPPSTHTSLADDDLDRICMKALAADIGDRYPTAAELAEDFASWLDGARKRERAMIEVQKADALVERANTLEEEARELASKAEQALVGVAKNAPVSDKITGWDLEERAKTAAAEARQARSRSVRSLRNAVSHAPDLIVAHDRLADSTLRRHRELEVKDPGEASPLLEELAEHDRSRRYAGYLSGIGALTLVTDPPGAEVRLFRYELQERRLQPVFQRVLGKTPLVELPLEMGSFLLTLHKEGHTEVNYPVHITRQHHWDGVAPDESEPFAIRLPVEGELAEDECYVPAGWFIGGDDDFDTTLPRRRWWADGLVVGRFPVTVREYCSYLNALIEAGDGDAVYAAEPIMPDTEREHFLGRGPDGLFVGIRNDRSDGHWPALRREDTSPIILTTWHQARAYLSWLGAREGKAWRLPAFLEWQKAARGVDGRDYPWGNEFDPTWARMLQTTSSIPTWVPVTEHPCDVSPHGIRGLAGNISDFTVDRAPQAVVDSTEPRVRAVIRESERRLAAGGAYGSGPIFCRAYAPVNRTQDSAHPSTGFRKFRNL